MKKFLMVVAAFAVLFCSLDSEAQIRKRYPGMCTDISSPINSAKPEGFLDCDWFKAGSGTSTPTYVRIQDADSSTLAQIDSEGQLHVVLNGKVDASNSTATNLGAGATFTGTAMDTLAYAAITVMVYTDQVSTADGLDIQWSSDGTNWDEHDYFTIPATNGKVFTFFPVAQYIRVLYTNGGVPQGTFRLQTILKKTNIQSSSHRIADAISGQDDAVLIKAVITGENPGGTFVNFQSTTAGNFKISLEEFESSVSSNANTQLNITPFDSSGNEMAYAVHDSPALARGPQVMFEARTSRAAAVGNGDAVRPTTNEYGEPINAGYTYATNSERKQEINPLSEHYLFTPIADVTDGADSAIWYPVIMTGKRFSAYQIDLDCDAGTVTATLECTYENDCAPAACNYHDFTLAVTGYASLVATVGSASDTWTDNAMRLGSCKYVRVKIDPATGGTTGDWKISGENHY